MINNGGFDKKVFIDILNCLRIGGFAIFATKLNYFKQDIYDADIKQLSEEGFWRYTGEHQFFRYDKLCGNIGQFSNKEVKILAYQKIQDYEDPELKAAQLRAEQEEKERLKKEEEAAEKAAAAEAKKDKKKKK